ncbi:MAG: hypothetical protein ACRC3F_00775, partial [Billgrantia desiderata]
NVDLDAGKAISVEAASLNTVDIGSLWGMNLYTAGKAFDDLEGTYDHTSSEGAVATAPSEKVLVADGHQAGGEAGSVYRFLGENAENIDLASEDFSDDERWENLGTPLNIRIGEFVDTLNGYTSGDLGLPGSFDSWTMATAEGSKLAVAGSANVFLVNQNSDARIREGARINLGDETDIGAVEPQAGQSVSVVARNDNHLFSLIGNVSLPSFSGANKADGDAWKKAFKNDIDTIKSGLAGVKSEGSAIGAAVGVHLLGGSATAMIERGVELVADSLDVRASNETLLLGMGVSSGQADKVAFNATAVANIVNNFTLAQVQDGVRLKIGNGSVEGETAGPSLRISANDDTYAFGIAGGVARGGSVGIGASVVVSVIERDTTAVLGSLAEDLAFAGRIAVGGDALVEANTFGVVVDMALAGAKAGGKAPSGVSSDSGSGSGGSGGGSGEDDPNKWPNNQSNYDNVLAELTGKLGQGGGSGGGTGGGGGDKKGGFGVGVSGSVVVHVGNDDTQALVQGLELFDVSGSTRVAANDSTHLGLLAGGASLSLGGSGAQVAVAGAAALAFQDGITRA